MKDIDSTKKIALYVGIIFQLFYSFYFYEVGIAPFSLLSAVILTLFCYFNYSGLKGYFKNEFAQITLLVFLFIGSLIWSIFVSYCEDYSFYPKSFVSMILNLGIFFGFISFALNVKLRDHGYRALLLFFLISLFLFFLQAFGWYLFEYEIDFLQGVTGEEQRLIGHQMEVQGVITRRVSGIFAEPAVYAWIMVGIGHGLLDRIQKKKYRLPLHIAYLVSVFASFSLTGWILALGSEILKAFSTKKIRIIVYLIIFFVVFAYVFYDFFELYWENRISNLDDDGSYNDRLGAYGFIQKIYMDWPYALLGIGVATRLDSNSMSFVASSMLLFGIFGTILIYGILISIIFKLPGVFLNKVFIIMYNLIFGLHITSTISWFVLGAMTFLMIFNQTRLEKDLMSFNT